MTDVLCIQCHIIFSVKPSLAEGRKYCSHKCSGDARIGIKRPDHSRMMSMEGNPRWTNNPGRGIDALHTWVRRRLPKPKKCQMCKASPPRDLANKSGKYLPDLTDWEWLCRKCHMISDGRIKNLKQYKETAYAR